MCPCCHRERPDPAEVLIAARRLAGARPHLAAVAGLVHPEDLWQLCRDELTGAEVRIDGWDIRGRWFGVVVGPNPRLGAAPRRDDPLAHDCRPDGTARTPRLPLIRRSPALTGGTTSPLLSGTIVGSGGSATVQTIFGGTTEIQKEITVRSLGL